MVLKVFFYGMAIALAAAFIEIAILQTINFLAGTDTMEDYSFLVFVLYNFLGIAFVEEYIKYFVVKKSVLKNSAFDEPVDAQLYMIISALGFAALENILILFPIEKNLLFSQIMQSALITTGLRFVGATFLHALCSGTLGFFLALSICQPKNKIKLLFYGLFLSTVLHGLYNFSIIKMFDTEKIGFLLIPIIILISLAIFTLYGFRKLNKIKGACQV